MKNLLYIILATALAFISCNKVEMNEGELVTLNYEVSMPGLTTKSETIGDGSHVNQVICAVFENGQEHSALRQVLQRNQDGTFPNFQPSLYLGKEYQLVFWAHMEGKYNVTDMANITYGTNGYATNDETMDAFTLTQTVKINNDRSVTIGKDENASTVTSQSIPAVLKRPFAKLNVGTLASDWIEGDGAITYSRITLSVIQTHFNAVTGAVVSKEKSENKSYSAAIVPQTFTATIKGENGQPVPVEYKYVSLNYLFPGSLATVKIEVATKDFNAADFNDATDIICVVTKENVPVNANKQTSLIGNVRKSDLNFSITVDGTFDDTQNNVGY